jgi:hypothetical protein
VEGDCLKQQIFETSQEEVERFEEEDLFCTVCPLKRENLELGCERGYRQQQHRRAVEREKRS